MASVVASPALMTALDRAGDLFDFDFANQHDRALTRFLEQVFETTEPQLDTLSAALVRLSFPHASGAYQLSLTGAGLSPVTSLEALYQAIENGVASGALTALTLTQNGQTLASLGFSGAGLRISSGNDQVLFKGTLPTSFTQIFELANLSGRMEDLDGMGSRERQALINDLTKFGITGFTLTDEGHQIADVTLTASKITLTSSAMTLEANGSFPANFGRVLDVLLQIEAQTDRGLEVDPTKLTGLGLNSLTLRNAAGETVLQFTGPFDGKDLTSFVINGTAGADRLDLTEFPLLDTQRLQVDLGAGNDSVAFDGGAIASWMLYPGPATALAWDSAVIDGGTGVNRLELTSERSEATTTLDLGKGSFLVREALTTRTSDVTLRNFQEVEIGGSGSYAVIGSARDETLVVAADYRGRSSNGMIRFDGGAGHDILDLSATAPAAAFQPITRAMLDRAVFLLEADGSLQITPSAVEQNGAWQIDRLPSLTLKNVEQIRVLTSEASQTATTLVDLASYIDTSRSLFPGQTAYGSWLDDVMIGSTGAEVIHGNEGNDRLIGAEGDDTLYGGDGNDTLNGGAGDDFLYGGASEADLRDLIYGGDGNDWVDGGWGNDEIYGGAGNDSLYGGFGADTLIGNEGDDLISGGAGSDEIHGGAGNDWINGGFGHDRLNGGAGADTFYHQGVFDHGSDWIQDCRAAQGDALAVGLAGAARAQFQINYANTPGAGAADVAEAFVVYRPTGQVMFALVDGAAEDNIYLMLNGSRYDLMA